MLCYDVRPTINNDLQLMLITRAVLQQASCGLSETSDVNRALQQ